MYYVFFTDVLFSIGSASKENEATSKNNIGEGNTHARTHAHTRKSNRCKNGNYNQLLAATCKGRSQ